MRCDSCVSVTLINPGLKDIDSIISSSSSGIETCTSADFDTLEQEERKDKGVCEWHKSSSKNWIIAGILSMSYSLDP